MPTPNKGEKKGDFVSRCIGELHKEKGRWESSDQIIAVCESMWEQHDKHTKKKGDKVNKG
jgi:hypothetical protein